MPKYTIHIPTKDYAFIEAEMETDKLDDVLSQYWTIEAVYKKGLGLAEAVFQKVLDRYLYEDEAMDSEEYAAMSVEQITIIQNIKRAKARKVYRETKDQVKLQTKQVRG